MVLAFFLRAGIAVAQTACHTFQPAMLCFLQNLLLLSIPVFPKSLVIFSEGIHTYFVEIIRKSAGRLLKTSGQMQDYYFSDGKLGAKHVCVAGGKWRGIAWEVVCRARVHAVMF